MNVADYWEDRYRKGGISGAGSRGEEAQHKAALVQKVIDENAVSSVLDLGCGDGEVAAMISVDNYVGQDLSPSALYICRYLMPDRTFVRELGPLEQDFDLVISLDVMHHLVNETDYRTYLQMLFSHSPLVFVYGTDHWRSGRPHVLHRRWTPDVPEGWTIRTVTPVASEFKRAWLLQRT